MLSGEVILQVVLIVGGVLGYFRLQREHTNKIEAAQVQAELDRKALKNDMDKAREADQSENQRLIRDTLAAERAENLRKDRALEQLTQDNARHAEMRAAAETKADERNHQVIVLERQLGQTIDKALNEAKTATEERVRREMLQKENNELRGRVSELEEEVKVIPAMEEKISRLEAQVKMLMAEKDAKDKEIDQLRQAVANDAA